MSTVQCGLVVLVAMACSSSSDRPAGGSGSGSAVGSGAGTGTANAGSSGATDAGADANDAPEAGDAAATPATSKVLQVVMDGRVTCVRRADGRVRCWGSQRSGARSTTPIEVDDALDAVAIELTADRLYVVTREGAVRAGPLRLPAAPTLDEVLAASEAIDVRAEADRAFVLHRTGEVRALVPDAPTLLTNVIAFSHHDGAGIDALHRDGRITAISARGTSTVRGLDDATELIGTRCARRRSGTIRCYGTGRPKPWQGPSTVVTRLVSGRVTCDLAESGVACAGANDVGQLGTGPGPDQRLGRVIDLPRKPIALAAGDRAWCAVLDDGALACWGGNDGGQLGDGTLIDRPTPVTVPGAISDRPPAPVADPPVAGSATAMDWSGLPEGCKRPATIKLAPDATVSVVSAYGHARASGFVVWLADFPLEPGGYRPGYPVTRGGQRALELTLQKGASRRKLAAIDRGRYRGGSGPRRAAWSAHHRDGIDRFAADILVERIDKSWICGTVLDPEDAKQRAPFAARIQPPRFR